ncbi:IS630 family transposase, partial [Deltaproteobacteria bacterium TL4]
KLHEIVTETTVIQSGKSCFHKTIRMERRIEIVNLIKEEIPTKEICAYTGYPYTTVVRWKNRDEITDLPRSGRPPIHGEEQRLRLIGFYCQVLPEWGGRWSLRTAEKQLASEPNDIGPIPKSTIARTLSSHKLKPHRSRYFLNITDPDFFQKMESLIELFLNRPKNLYAFDESPGIQILQRLVPDLRTEETKKRLEEFEYIRNGTLDLFLCLDVNSGKINCEVHSNHSTEKFVLFMENHFKSVSPSEPLHYVLDNLNTHCSYAICELVARFSRVACPSEIELSTMEKRRNWLKCNEKRIIFHYTPFHGSWLNPAEIGIGVVSAKCFKESYSSADGLYDAIMKYIDFRNRNMASPFNWKYDGEGLHEKAIKRLTQQIKGTEANTVELRIMTKQFVLAKNILHNYNEKISEQNWEMFKMEFLSKEEEFQQKVNVEEGPKRKENAQSALDELKKALVDKLPQPIKKS